MTNDLEVCVRRAIAEELDARRSVDADQHAQHHAWIKAQIARDEERAKFYSEMRKTAAQWALSALLALLVYKLFGFKVGVE